MVIDIQRQNILAHQGDNFHHLVEETRKDLFRLLLNFTQNHHDAEDLLQETYLKAYRNLPDFRADSSLFTWLYRIALNLAMSTKRSQKRSPILNTGLDTAQAQAQPSSEDQHADLEQRRIRQQISQVMAQFSPMEKAVFVLRHHMQYSVQQTAELLGNAEGTIKSLHFRAIRKLRDELVPRATHEEGL